MGQLVSDVTSVLNYKKDKKDVANQRQQILTQIANDQATKANLVKKALAKQRASYGAGGMAGTGMTEEAVLNRLRSETEDPVNQSIAANMEKLSKIKKTQSGSLLKSLVTQFGSLLA